MKWVKTSIIMPGLPVCVEFAVEWTAQDMDAVAARRREPLRLAIGAI